MAYLSFTVVRLNNYHSARFMTKPHLLLQVMGSVVEVTNYQFILFTFGYGPLNAATKGSCWIGLINYCAPAGDAYSKALEIACDINQKGPVAIRMTKRVISHGSEMEIGSGLELEEECYEVILVTDDRYYGQMVVLL
ncbi:unnamed protein product [Lactuca virosa]|uniref:Uncharacterized protein n=1 Tax=Lactuca virosa TaxID=75947 RepID=A0AAU9PC28_9ASTR|nr:unnamed protein product [Lactuca virosa]